MVDLKFYKDKQIMLQLPVILSEDNDNFIFSLYPRYEIDGQVFKINNLSVEILDTKVGEKAKD